jgi:AraC family transcriptional regulator
MLLTALPDLASSSAEFRSWFHAKWGRENCIVLGHARRAEFGPCTHTLSIRAAWGGTEHCRIGPRCVGVDDDNFLILNHGRVYSTSIRAQWPVESLAICFRPGLAQETCAAMAMSIERALEQGAAIDPVGPEFAESLQPHDQLVSPVLRFIRAHLLLGVRDEAWYEEQLHFLLARMQTHRARQLRLADELRILDPSRRRELMRRVGFATDFLNTHYAQSLALDDLAKAACLSKHHLLRVFTRVHGATPFVYLQRKRVAAALRLLQTARLTVSEVALSVGFPDRTTLLRHIRSSTGFRPVQIRTRSFVQVHSAGRAVRQ